MIIVFKQNATVEEKTKLKNQLESKEFQIHASDKCVKGISFYKTSNFTFNILD